MRLRVYSESKSAAMWKSLSDGKWNRKMQDQLTAELKCEIVFPRVFGILSWIIREGD